MPAGPALWEMPARLAMLAWNCLKRGRVELNRQARPAATAIRLGKLMAGELAPLERWHASAVIRRPVQIRRAPSALVTALGGGYPVHEEPMKNVAAVVKSMTRHFDVERPRESDCQLLWRGPDKQCTLIAGPL